jgi:hypothetical protein
MIVSNFITRKIPAKNAWKICYMLLSNNVAKTHIRIKVIASSFVNYESCEA